MKTLHIIAFDIPFPANYGGVIDIYYKLKNLKKNNFKITLHCFEYGRERSKKLDELCDKIYYYKRNIYKNPLTSNLPYIVETRSSKYVLRNLLQDEAPILFEGLHTTYFLDHPQLKNRYKILRTHNVEHEYYKHLEWVEKNFFKKYFFRIESERLKKYQKRIHHANLLCPLSLKDELYFKKIHPNVKFIAPFHINNEILIKEGKGDFILYHGNLAVGENNQAALFLLKEVFSKIKFPVIIAGSKPSKELTHLVNKLPNVSLQVNIGSDKIYELIQQAQINLLYTEQATGVKLKLINSLYLGKFCMVNEKMIKGTKLHKECIVCSSPIDFVDQIELYFQASFDAKKIKERKEFLKNSIFDLAEATKNIVSLISSQKQEALN